MTTTTVRAMTHADTDWVASLYAANSRDALTPQERAEHGFVQGRMDPEAIARRRSDLLALVAEVDGERAGLLFASEAGAFPDGPPGLTLSTAREAGLRDFYLYGPVLVAPEARGKGVLRALADEAFARTRDRFTTAVAFVEDENTASAATHARLGWRQVGTFEWQGRGYSVIAYDLP